MVAPADFLLNRGAGADMALYSGGLGLGARLGLGAWRPWTISCDGRCTFPTPVAAMPDSFEYMVISFWIAGRGAPGMASDVVGYDGHGWQIFEYGGASLDFLANTADGTGQMLAATFPTDSSTGAVDHYLFSCSSSAGIAQLAINGALVTAGDISQLNPGPILNTAPSPPPDFTATINAEMTAGETLAELFVHTPDAFFDLTDPANIALFYGGFNVPVYLGRHGELPFGAPAAMYHTVADFPADGGGGDDAERLMRIDVTVTPRTATGVKFRLATIDFIDGPYQPEFNRIEAT